MELSLAMESAYKDADTLKAGAMGTTSKSVLQMAVSRGRRRAFTKRNPRRADQNSNATCYRCQGKHLATVCQFKDAHNAIHVERKATFLKQAKASGL